MKEIAEAVDEGELGRAEAMILSMTPEERRNPGIISGSRRLRIANGSGVTTADVNTLLKDFEGARKMMRTMMGGPMGRQLGRELGGEIPAMTAEPIREGSEGEEEEEAGARTACRRRIRLRRMGANKRPFYRVVVADQRAPRDGRFIEAIGKYHPLERPFADRDRRGARAPLAPRRRPAVEPGAQPDEQGRHLGEFVAERPNALQGVKPAKERPEKPKLSKKAQAKAAEAAAVPSARGRPPRRPKSRRRPKVPARRARPTDAEASTTGRAVRGQPEAAEADAPRTPSTEADERLRPCASSSRSCAASSWTTPTPSRSPRPATTAASWCAFGSPTASSAR